MSAIAVSAEGSNLKGIRDRDRAGALPCSDSHVDASGVKLMEGGPRGFWTLGRVGEWREESMVKGAVQLHGRMMSSVLQRGGITAGDND